MIILGLTSSISWNQAAALIVDGKFIAIGEEERFVGIKHAPRMLPTNSIEFCLSFANIKPQDIDVIAIGFRSPFKYYFYTLLENFKERDFIRAAREMGTLSEYAMGMIRFAEWLQQKGFKIKVNKRLKMIFFLIT